MVCFGVLDVATVPPTIALSRACYGTDGPIVFGWALAAHQVGAGLVAYGGGVARDVFGSYDLVWLFVGGLCGVAALLSLALRTDHVAADDGPSASEAVSYPPLVRGR